MDGVCSVASEEIRMDTWDLDVVLTASQKGLGAPAGLSILVASQRALKVSIVCWPDPVMGITNDDSGLCGSFNAGDFILCELEKVRSGVML